MAHWREALRFELRRLADQLVEQSSSCSLASYSGDVREAARRVGIAQATRLGARSVPSFDPECAPIDVVDFFSGCGGMSAGFRALSATIPAFRLAGALDIDPVANRTYERNLGHTPRGMDVRHLLDHDASFQEFETSLNRQSDRPLVLIGCAPCQGFSSYRKDGLHDARNSLIEVFAKLAVRLGPEVLIMENVPELMAQRHWPYFEAAKQTLEEAGYNVRARVYNLAEFGVPQERFRVVIFAMHRPFIMPEGFLERSNFVTVREAIGHLPPLEPGESIPEFPMHVCATHREETVQTIRRVPKDGGSRPFDAGPESLRRAYYRQGRQAFEDVYGRLFWDRSAITITQYSRNPASGRFVHPEQDRGLTALEAALLQGFPEDYVFEGSLDDRFRQIGNAVPPRFSGYLASHVLGEMLALDPPNMPDTGDICEPIGSSFSRIIGGLKRRERVV